jgi:hypothetical protein
MVRIFRNQKLPSGNTRIWGRVSVNKNIAQRIKDRDNRKNNEKFNFRCSSSGNVLSKNGTRVNSDFSITPVFVQSLTASISLTRS